jgi:hypothetical protein
MALATSDEQQIRVGGASHFKAAEQDGCALHLLGAQLGQILELLLPLQQLVFPRHRAEHGVGFDQPDLRRQKLVGIISARSRGGVSDHAGRRLPVDIDHGGGFVDGGYARRDNERGQLASGNEGQYPPAMPPQDPKVMRKGRGAVVTFRIGWPVRKGRRPDIHSRHG